MRRTATLLALLATMLCAAPLASAGTERLLAPPSACSHQGQLTAPTSVQETAMVCMVNYARTRAGLRTLRTDDDLFRSADHKGSDIVRCDSFSHTACGRDFAYWIERVGYMRGGCWSAAENIAWGTGRLGTVRSIFRSWLESRGHRENILGGYADLGVAVRVGALDGQRTAHVWIQHFAKRC